MGAVTAYLGLGSNLGERDANLEQAMRLLGSSVDTKPIRSSSVYETAPWGYSDQPSFLNCVLEIQTTLEPIPLLELAQSVEAKVGRLPTFRWGPRLVDIDILLYGDRTVSIDSPDLQIPHCRMSQRAFVLVPLAEIAAELEHPVLKLLIEALAQRVEGKEGVSLWRPPLQMPNI